MQYLNQEELKKMLLKSYERIEERKEDINKINVFPVPDQDTGNNMAKTLLGVKNAIHDKKFQSLEEVCSVTLNAALTAAQGNAGVIYTGFLAGFLPVLQNNNPVNANRLNQAMKEGAARARESIQNPKEGTILDVIDATAKSIEEDYKNERNITLLLKRAIEKAHDALLATREKMAILKKANVVDAGGLGYLIILESYLEALQGEDKEKEVKIKPSDKVKRFVQTLSYRYEVVFLLVKPKIEMKKLKEKLSVLGNSLEVLQIGDRIKVHIHTDEPEEIKEIARSSGKIQNLRVEDMAKEIIGEKSVKETSIGIVTEDVSALLPKIIERYKIEIVPVKLDWPEIDKMPGENIFQKMREMEKRGIKKFGKTSQPSPKDFMNAYRKQLDNFDKVLCITLTSKISGSWNSAKEAETLLKEPQRVFVVDSFHAAASQALLILRAIELIQENREITEVMNELKNLTPKTHLYAIFQDPKWIEALGRVTKAQANWIRRIKRFNVHPVITIKDGKMSRGGIVFGKNMSEALFKKVAKESKKVRREGKRIRVVINHADNLKGARELRKMLKQEINADVSFISSGPPVICAASGPGTLIVGWAPLE